MNIMLTYPEHVEKTAFEFWIQDKLNDKNVEATIFVAHENGDEETPYKHSHVLVVAKKRIQTTDQRFFDYPLKDRERRTHIGKDGRVYEKLHPNIKPITTKTHLRNAYKYMGKEDTGCRDLIAWHLEEQGESSVEGFEKFKEQVKNITESETPLDAVLAGGNMKSALAALQIYEKCHKQQVEIDETTAERIKWVKTQGHWMWLMRRLLEDNLSRKILWIYDKWGAIGKSSFCDMMELEHNALLLTQFGGMKDFATVMQSVVETGWKGNIVMIDLPRDAEDLKIYAPMEELLNGRTTAIKYKGKPFRFGVKKVCVCANFFPNTSKASKDRWEVLDWSKFSPNKPVKEEKEVDADMELTDFDLKARRSDADMDDVIDQCINSL